MEKILGNPRVFWQAVIHSVFSHSLLPISAKIIGTNSHRWKVVYCSNMYFLESLCISGVFWLRNIYLPHR